IVDFIEASHIRYALTINPTVYVSHIREFWSTARIETTNEGTKILATVDGKPRSISESLIRRNLKLNDEEGISSLPDAELFENLALMGYNILPNQKFTFQKGQFSHQSKFLIHSIMQCLSPKSTGFNEFSSNIATAVKSPLLGNTRATRIAQSKALPTAADEPASLLRDDSQGEAFPTARIKLLEDKDRGSAELSVDDAPIKGRSMEIGEEAGVEKSTKRGTVSVPPIAKVSTIGVPTVSGLVPTISAIFTTASVVTPYSRRPREILAKDKGKEKMVETDTPKQKKLQEQIDVQVAREMEKEMARKDQRMNEQIARDAKIAKIHTEEELKMLIDGLDRNNEMIAKHLQEYEQSAAYLTIGEKIELINELVKYQDHHAKVLKYQAQQSKPLSKKEQMELYMSVLRSHAGWKTKHFRGITLEEIREKFILVWKQIEDFVPMSSTEEAQRMKRKGLKLDEGSAKKMKISEDVFEENLKGMMQLVPVEEVYVEALQVKHPIIDCEIHSEGKKIIGRLSD
nr:hypothetical protein [Tanacetum cinerariifolium]